MSDELGRTRTLGDESRRPPAVSAPHLFLVIEAARPRGGGTRSALVDLDEILLGRAGVRTIERSARRLRIGVPDDWMSSRHGVLRPERLHWTIEDAGSKNGVRINGVLQERAILRDGDVIELGRTFFLFRASAVVVPGEPPDLDLDGASASPGLATLVPELRVAFAELARIAETRTPVLLQGQTGSGKEVIARAVHELSGRRGAFVAVNCGAIPEALVESELFGYRKGAFSGAGEDRVGLVAASDGGTLFLDELGDLPLGSQAALLRSLEEQEVRPVGATTTTRVDLRVVAATHRDLEEMVAEERFREDLLARVTGFTMRLPALSERPEDLGLLIASLLPRVTKAPVAFANETIRALLRYRWPRNIRELVKCLERSIPLAAAGPVTLAHLPDAVAETPPAPRPPAHEELTDEQRAQRDQLIALLEQHRGNVSLVARSMGRVRAQIQRWMKRYGIDPDRFRS